IRDKLVTGVQTCALPISGVDGDEEAAAVLEPAEVDLAGAALGGLARRAGDQIPDERVGNPGPTGRCDSIHAVVIRHEDLGTPIRSEERRVGKEVSIGVTA